MNSLQDVLSVERMFPIQQTVITAPWLLTGQGLVFITKGQSTPNDHQPSEQPTLQGDPFQTDTLWEQHSRFGAVALLDFSSSGLGSYCEAIYIPGRCQYEGRWVYGIHHLVLSAAKHALAARHYWLPQRHTANFSILRHKNRERWRIRDGMRCSLIDVRTLWPHLPFTSKVLPEGLRSLAHCFGPRPYLSHLDISGVVAPTALHDFHLDLEGVPKLDASDILFGLRIESFRMMFDQLNLS